jgi:hypothetical protein
LVERQEKNMPKVDGKHYSYSPKGIAKAKAAAKKKGVKVKYRHGGMAGGPAVGTGSGYMDRISAPIARANKSTTRAMPRMMKKGGAAWKSEKKANPGIGNCPASVKKAL